MGFPKNFIKNNLPIAIERFKDMVKLGFRLKPIFIFTPSQGDAKNDAHFKSGQKRLKK